MPVSQLGFTLYIEVHPVRLGKRLPDILIGILIVVLAVGLGSLLLTQRNRAATTPAATPMPTVSIPGAPGTDTPTGPATATKPVATPEQPAVTSVPVQQPAPSSAATTPLSQPSEGTPAKSDNGSATTALTNTPAATATINTPPATSPATTALTPKPTETASPKHANSKPASSDGPVTTAELQPPSTPKVDTSKPPVVTTHSPVVKMPVPVAPTPAATAPQDTQTPAPQTPTATNQPVTQPAASVPPRSGGAVATSENRVPLRRDYRVSLGVFNSRAELERQTAAVSALGYTVYPIDIGGRFVAQVGPFANASSAQQAGRDIARSYPGATVMAPRGITAKPATDTSSDNSTTSSQAPTRSPASSTTSSSSGTDSSSNEPTPRRSAPAVTPAPSGTNTTNLDWQTPATSNDSSQSNDAPTTSTTAQTDSSAPSTQRPAPSGPVYLQVGAFSKPESAQALVSQLSNLGYDASVQAPENGRVTVLIGPFHGGALLRTESRLDANGLPHFRVR